MATAKLGAKTDFSYRINKVIKIVDGDTIDVIIDLGFDILHRARVRLYGIDTPESRTRDKEEKILGILSKNYLKDALKNGQKLVIKTHKGNETGKFGRILGEIFINDINFNLKMCSEGYAVAYYGQNKSLIVEAHLMNRKLLQERGLIK